MAVAPPKLCAKHFSAHAIRHGSEPAEWPNTLASGVHGEVKWGHSACKLLTMVSEPRARVLGFPCNSVMALVACCAAVGL